MSRFKMELQSKFDMVVFMRETGSEVVAAWQYNPDLFDETTISGLVSTYRVALQAVISNPKAHLGSLCELLGEATKTGAGRNNLSPEGGTGKD